MTNNFVFHGNTRHVEICHHFIRELVAKGNKMIYCNTNEQLVDIFMKSLSLEKIEYFKDMLGVAKFQH